ncbi:hypothetical protein CHELA40_13285 [Chelatococcus asaccharovorans]|nr:hypothetical protein CHELA40_13285 [Chelatococcus asaccharovorans]CAH1679091.1 hypothetical protein CHELA17_62335 [Chelatococcus asaccharovorans]
MISRNMIIFYTLDIFSLINTMNYIPLSASRLFYIHTLLSAARMSSARGRAAGLTMALPYGSLFRSNLCRSADELAGRS